ncbi:magnesium transporter NIPA-like protein [Phanerochaete sordida]|uniref:Magnesium transporter NIPA-like protein n=1 Tax=Phanerochaete sordida TaxID=48140 RepID=A0A9P3L9M8_9APHY|nr:magnesium transporter NIPA-like protein [Phanerochaete sordida]
MQQPGLDHWQVAMTMSHTLDADDPHISIPLGITVGILCSFIQSLGLTIQRKSHVQNQALPESERKVEHRRPLWLLGFGIFISSNLFGSIFQIASLPVVILAPLGAVSLLWNAFFARLILGDVFSPWMALSTLCIAGGAVLIAVFGIVPEPTRSLEDLLLLFSRPTFIVYFSLLGVFTVVSLAITHALEYASSRRIALPDDTPPLSPLLAPTTDPTILTHAATPNVNAAERNHDPTENSPLLDPKLSRIPSLSPPASLSTCISSSHTPLFLAMSYASFSGIISGMCLLLAKSGVELLVLTIAGKNQFLRWQTWALVLGLGICALLQLWYMHKSLVLADPTLVCPLAFCFYNLSSIVNGLIYFDQFSVLSTAHLLLVMLGIVILLAGVWIVSFPPGGSHRIDLSHWDESESEDDEEFVRYEDEPLPMAGTLRPEDEEIGMGRVSTSRERPATPPPLLVDLGSDHDDDEHTATTESPIDSPVNLSASSRSDRRDKPHARRQTDSALLSSQYGAPPTLSPVSPAHPLQPSPTRTRPRAALGHHSTLGPLSPRGAHGAHTHPLSPGAPSGFAIGFSPISPGFALVPAERTPRRRRVTSLTSVESVADVFAGAHARPPRRVISEGSRENLARAAQEHGEWGGDVEAQEQGQGGEARADQSEGQGEARQRWRWIAGVLARKHRR